MLLMGIDNPLGPSTTQNSTMNVNASIAETHLARAAAVRERLKLSAPSRNFTPSQLTRYSVSVFVVKIQPMNLNCLNPSLD